MVKEKLLRPRKARSQGEILADVTNLLTRTSFEDYHVRRSWGENIQFKEMNIRTINLNGHWIGVKFAMFQITSHWVYGHDGVIKAILTEEDDTPLVDEKVYFTVNNSEFIRRTDANGVVTLTYAPDYTGTADYSIEYRGNNVKGYREADNTLTGTINVEKIGVVITQENLQGIPGTTFEIRPVVKDEFGNRISGEWLKYNYGSYEIAEAQLNNGTCTFQRERTDVGVRGYWLSFPETEIYKHATCNFSITVVAYDALITPAHLSYEVEKGTNLTLRVAVVGAENRQPVDGGSVQLEEEGVYLGVQELNSQGVAEFTYNSNTIGTHTLTYTYIPSDMFNGTTRNITVDVTKKSTSVNITLGDITDWMENSGSFNIKVKNSNNVLVNEGTLRVTFKVTKIDESAQVASFNLANTTGNIDVTRQKLNLDAMYDILVGRKYLYYTGYTVLAEYLGTGNYATSSDEKQPVNLGVTQSQIYPFWTIQNSANYDIATEIPSLTGSMKSRFHIRVDHGDPPIFTIIENNNVSTRYNISNNIPIGNIKKGQTIYFATEYNALRIPDNYKNMTVSQYSQSGHGSSLMGGLTTELKYQINNGTVQDSANAYINGATTRYAGPLYVKFTVPNTVNVGDKIKLMFYVGYNKGYYHYISNSTEYGLGYVFELTVVE